MVLTITPRRNWRVGWLVKANSISAFVGFSLQFRLGSVAVNPSSCRLRVPRVSIGDEVQLRQMRVTAPLAQDLQGSENDTLHELKICSWPSVDLQGGSISSINGQPYWRGKVKTQQRGLTGSAHR